MDQINKTLNNLSLYEVKLYVRKAQNVVLSLSEMEAKVREATNNEPWGAPSSLMQQIAAGTYNIRERVEISNMIFRRFTEKSAHEWRQIYKLLQLLEYVIKNGSEKFVDAARQNLSIIQMLRSFHYIDSQGRDQGVNVRNRAKQLIALLEDESLIRLERKKLRQNQKKFGGVAGGKTSVNPNHRFTSTFDDDDDGGDYEANVGSYSLSTFDDSGYSNRVFGDGGVYGERYEEERAAGGSGNDQYEEYEVAPSRSSRKNSRTSKPTTKTSTVTARPQLDLDLFGDSAPAAAPATATATAAALDDDEDDFDDFQSAVPATNNGATLNSNNLTDLFSSPVSAFNPLPTATYSAPLPVPGAVPSQPSYNLASTSITTGPAPAKPKADAFSSLFSTAKTTSHSLNASRSVSAAKPAPQAAPAPALSDDLFDSFTPAPQTTSTNGNSAAKNNDIDLLSF